MVYVDTLTDLSIIILLMRLLCVLMTSNYDHLLITSMFSQCSNPRHVSHHDFISDAITVSTVPTPSVLYHYIVRFSSNLQSLLTITSRPSLSGLVVPPTNEVWLSFDSVVNSFGSHLLSWPGSNVTHFMLETSTLHFRIATFFILVPLFSSLHCPIFSIIYIDSTIVAHSSIFLLLALKLATTVIFNSFPVTNPVITILTVTRCLWILTPHLILFHISLTIPITIMFFRQFMFHR